MIYESIYPHECTHLEIPSLSWKRIYFPGPVSGRDLFNCRGGVDVCDCMCSYWEKFDHWLVGWFVIDV